MEQVYAWLYDHYGEPRLRTLPAFQDAAAEPLVELAPEDAQLDLRDALNILRLNWCTAAFEMGVRFGMKLTEEGRNG